MNHDKPLSQESVYSVNMLMFMTNNYVFYKHDKIVYKSVWYLFQISVVLLVAGLYLMEWQFGWFSKSSHK